jgi:hypothetical protein
VLSPILLVETPRKFPGGFISPTRAFKLGAIGTLRAGDLDSRTDGTRRGVPANMEIDVEFHHHTKVLV